MLSINSNRVNVRVAIVSLAAASAGLSMAAMSLGKLFLLLTVLLVLLRNSHKAIGQVSWQALWTPKLVIVILAAFAGSLLWTTGPFDQDMEAVGKYGKLLVIPALLILIRSRQEATLALTIFLGFQTFLLLSSWLLYFHVPVVWASGKHAKEFFAVFSTYLDQSIISAVVAALFWHLKALAPNRLLFYGAIAISLLALGSVFFVFVGRTGQLVGLTMVGLAVFWALPRRYRLASIVMTPLIPILAFSLGAIPQRFVIAGSEVSSYMDKPAANTSTGIRLYFWKTSLEAMAQKPLAGSGVGSWTTEYNKIERRKNADFEVFKVASNPHQEFLLWGVQLGVGGVLLLMALMGAVMKDFHKMDPPVARAGQSIVAALVVSCLFNSSLYDANIGSFFCLSIGVMLAYGLYAGNTSHR
ncbi:O-antigen ligase family protein [Rhodoferax sp.]|uniref:O-antigen ligase family protein n=1 Tax=Rhodoferax sp. TaxID=50421 RepID=UPI0019F10247|nr:O-antigen ligase family protein [Rhodoferax sp.]MBE0473027.1 O-antigen ligase family protein [Rhodoferax sp.]